jgi:hypothetical protein
MVDPLVLAVLAMAEVESGYVHTGANQFPQALGATGGGTDGADDLGVAHGRDPTAKALSNVTRATPRLTF